MHYTHNTVHKSDFRRYGMSPLNSVGQKQPIAELLHPLYNHCELATETKLKIIYSNAISKH